LFSTPTDGQRQQRLRLRWHFVSFTPRRHSARGSPNTSVQSTPHGRVSSLYKWLGAKPLLSSFSFPPCPSTVTFTHGPIGRNVRHCRRTVVGWQVQLALTLANSGEAHCIGIGGEHTVPLLANVLEEVHTPELAPCGCEEGAQAACLRMGAQETSSCRACTPAREAVLISMPSSGPDALECGHCGLAHDTCAVHACRDGAKMWDCRPSDYPYGA
jgi:hypothetical protein